MISILMMCTVMSIFVLLLYLYFYLFLLFVALWVLEKRIINKMFYYYYYHYMYSKL